MLIIAVPLCIIQYVVGQRFKRCAAGCWTEIHPALRGIGIASLILSGYFSVYYVIVMAWALFYMAVSADSFGVKLPWDKSKCPR